MLAGLQSIEASVGGIASQPRLLIPIILALGYNRWNQLFAEQVRKGVPDVEGLERKGKSRSVRGAVQCFSPYMRFLEQAVQRCLPVSRHSTSRMPSRQVPL
jgi:hypothetical protein